MVINPCRYPNQICIHNKGQHSIYVMKDCVFNSIRITLVYRFYFVSNERGSVYRNIICPPAEIVPYGIW
jgi:hypothetical protein